MPFTIRDLADSILGERTGAWLAVIGCAPQSLLPSEDGCRPTQRPAERGEPIDFVFGKLGSHDLNLLRRALRDMDEELEARENELRRQEDAEGRSDSSDS